MPAGKLIDCLTLKECDTSQELMVIMNGSVRHYFKRYQSFNRHFSTSQHPNNVTSKPVGGKKLEDDHSSDMH